MCAFWSLFVLLAAFCSLSSHELSQVWQRHLKTWCYAGMKIHLPSRENHVFTTLLSVTLVLDHIRCITS